MDTLSRVTARPRITAAYRANVVDVRRRVDAAVAGAWNGLPEYREENVDAFARTVVPVVTGAARRVATLAAAYLAALEAEALGIAARPVGIPLDVSDPARIRGVASLLDVYRRPGVTVWTALANGVPFSKAVDQGLDRARTLAASDVQLAKTHASRYVTDARPRIVGYKREPNGGSCPLCSADASTTYPPGDLMPTHPGCNCDVVPVFGERDVASIDRSAEADDVLAVHEHGELGPVLEAAGVSFAGPSVL